MIAHITKEQQKYFDELIQKYLNEITDFPELNKEECEKAITEIYKKMGYKKPIILYGKNPFETVFIAALVKHKKGLQLDLQLDEQLDSQLHPQLALQLGLQLASQLDEQLYSQLESQLYPQLALQLNSQLDSQLDEQLRSQLRSQLDLQLRSQLISQLDLQLGQRLRRQLDSQLGSINNNWYNSIWWRFWDCYYQFGKYIGVNFDNDKLELFNKFLTNVYFCIPYDGICFVSEPPIKTYWNNNKQLHRDGGSSVQFKSSLDVDTFGIYCLNGIKVSKEVAETPAGLLKPEMYNKIKNIDEKAEFIRKIGIDRMVEQGEEIDTFENHKYSANYQWYKDSEYKIIDMSCLFPNDYNYLPYLYMKNQTTGIYHLECCYDPNSSEQPRTIIEGLTLRQGGIDPENTEILFIK